MREDRRRLRRIDLDLLGAFDALFTERSVSRAAERLGISQSSMSAALARLREIVRDPLFSRTAAGMVPTARANELHPAVADLLQRAGNLLQGEPRFQPLDAQARFSIQSGSDYLVRVLVPPLARAIERRAPGVRLIVHPPNPRAAARMLTEGQLDLGIGYLPDPPDTLHRKLLLADGWVLLLRQGHPLAGSSPDLGAYCAARHVDVSPAGARHYGRVIDGVLRKASAARNVVLTVPGFLAVAPIVAQTELVATVPRRVAELARADYPLVSLALPVALPELEISLYWHERSHRDPLHRWLRALVQEVSLTA